MSTQPLLSSYNSATRHRDQSIIIPAASLIQSLSFLIFAGTTTLSTLWAWRSNSIPDPAPPASAPLLPYFASMCLIISLGCWVGYLVFISYDAAGGPRIQRRIIIWTSFLGKVILAGAHVGFGILYKHSFPDSAQPNWVIVFLAAQAWWDFMLFLVYSCLRSGSRMRH